MADHGAAYEARVNAVERLTGLFKLERCVYLCATIVSLVMLLSSAAYLILRNSATSSVLGLLFGSSGIIAYSTGRLLRMWDMAMTVLKDAPAGKGGD